MIQIGRKYKINSKVNLYIEKYSWNPSMRKCIGEKFLVNCIDGEKHSKLKGIRQSDATEEQIKSGLITVAYGSVKDKEYFSWDYIPVECLDEMPEKINKILNI